MKNKNASVRFVHPSTISDHLRCPICTIVYYKPYRLMCGHVYCCECFELYVRAGGRCPVDRSKVENDCVHMDSIARKIVDGLQCFCVYRHAGCSWIGKRCLLEGHQRLCEYRCDDEGESYPLTTMQDDEELRERIEYEINDIDIRKRTCRRSNSSGFSSDSQVHEYSIDSKVRYILDKMDEDNDILYDLNHII